VFGLQDLLANFLFQTHFIKIFNCCLYHFQIDTCNSCSKRGIVSFNIWDFHSEGQRNGQLQAFANIQSQQGVHVIKGRDLPLAVLGNGYLFSLSTDILWRLGGPCQGTTPQSHHLGNGTISNYRRSVSINQTIFQCTNSHGRRPREPALACFTELNAYFVAI
jgi:hypothetical protein